MKRNQVGRNHPDHMPESETTSDETVPHQFISTGSTQMAGSLAMISDQASLNVINRVVRAIESETGWQPE